MSDRLRRLAIVMGLTPTDRLRCEKQLHPVVRWYLLGCVEGDQPLPYTKNVPTLPQALDAAEAWLAPEIDAYDVKRLTDRLLNAETPESEVEEELRSYGLDPEELRAKGREAVERARKKLDPLDDVCVDEPNTGDGR